MTRNKSDRELSQIQDKLEYQGKDLKVFIADIIPTCSARENMEDRLVELESLVITYGGLVILKHIQKRGTPDYNTYIGSGKLDEIIEEMKETGASLLIFGDILKPHQIYKINEKLRTIGAKAWDRVDLILKIFEKNARTEESRLQIELASVKHMGPRIFGMGMELSRQGGGSKLARGKGETNTEIMKRHLRDMVFNIKKELERYALVRGEHRKSRKKKGFFTVGIVGYTNAGKSSLLNSLTHKGVLSEDKLFATLGTSVGKMWIENHVCHPEHKFAGSMIQGKTTKQNIKDSETSSEGQYVKGTEILLNDTIGFIRDLPPDLIKAFASTLEDSIESDLLLHIIDASDSKIDEKIKVVEEILSSIGAKQKRLYVFNKIDTLTTLELKDIKKRFNTLKPIFISSRDKVGLDDLKKEILKKL